MKLKKILGCLLIGACISVMGIGVSAASADSYQETAFAFQNPDHAEIRLARVVGRPNGNVDYFVNRAKDLSEIEPAQFHSSDYGKTWSQVNMDFYQKIKQKYPKSVKTFSCMDFYITEQNVLYAIIQVDSKSVKQGNENVGCPVLKIFRVEGDSVQEIPNLSFGDTNLPQYKIARVEADGTIAMIQHVDYDGGGAETSAIVFIDPKTGSIKKKTPCPDSKWRPLTYANNTVFCIQDKNGNATTLHTYDAQTGKAGLSIPLPGPDKDNFYAVSACSKSDGTTYISSQGGLFRLDPGASALVKIVDGASSRLKGNVWAGDSDCSEDGVVYIPIRELNSTIKGVLHGNGSLYCYRPR